MADSYQRGKRQLLKAAAALPLQAVALGAPRLVGLTGLFAGTTALAQDFPSRPIRIVVPYAAGGVTDAAARAIATEMSKQLGQPVVVDNKAGAGGMIGANEVAKSAPDGYNICFCASGVFVIQPHLGAKLPLNPMTELQPLIRVYDADLVLSVNPASGIRTFADLMTKAKSAQGVTYASVGVGSLHHLGMETMAKRTGGKFVHIAYKGDAPAITDLLGGQIDLALLSTQAASNLAKSGKVSLIASTGAERAPGLPDVPTLGESGVKDTAYSTWIGMFVPAATPKPIVDRLYSATSTVLASPSMKEWMAAQGLRPSGQNGADMKVSMTNQSAQWGALVRELNIKAE